MKKIITALSLSTLLVLAACGDENANTETENNDDTNQNNTEEVVENEQNNEEANEENEVNNVMNEDNENDVEETADEMSEGAWETEVGDTVETEGGTFTLHARQDDIDTIESGPIVINIEQINTASGETAGMLKEMTEQDELDYIQIDLNVENTADEDITFYAGQARISTSTGEQLESDMWLSDHIDGDLMSGTSHNGSFFFMLENSNAEDVESIRITWGAPTDLDWEEVGEPIDIEIEL
ncbi:hypothetical protein [Salipaludibacillus daqingensis]|uniref:hypothetical protein n=1 Tax=Salipaludibacillus daqingensis TaxID=3041001 RepID=UPI00247705EC|nr:hypothetical protein [Salipaludibacillus daqingensis]